MALAFRIAACRCSSDVIRSPSLCSGLPSSSGWPVLSKMATFGEASQPEQRRYLPPRILAKFPGLAAIRLEPSPEGRGTDCCGWRDPHLELGSKVLSCKCNGNQNGKEREENQKVEWKPVSTHYRGLKTETRENKLWMSF